MSLYCMYATCSHYALTKLIANTIPSSPEAEFLDEIGTKVLRAKVVLNWFVM
jgi:hypothetical protein